MPVARLSALLAPLFVLAACSQSEEPAVEVAEPDTAARLDAIYAEYNEDNLKLNPVIATFRGDTRYNDQWGIDSLSDAYLEADLAMHRKYYDQVTAIDPEVLSGQDRLSYDVFVLARQDAIESHEKGFMKIGQLLPINQLFSTPTFLAQLGSGQSAQPFNTAEDYDNWLSRSASFAQHVDFMISRLREGVEAGVVQPTILMEKTLPQLAAHIVEDPEQSIFWQPIVNMPGLIVDEDRTRLAEAYRAHISDVLVPAYERLHNHIRDDYMQNTRDTIARAAIPGGEEWYAWLVRQSTTTTLTPEEIHEIGKREAARLFDEMEKVRDQVGFEGDMKAFFDFLQNDPQFFFASREEIVQGYDALREVIDPKLDKLFATQPKTNYVLKAVEEFRERAAPTASYQAGTPDGSRPGIFYINTYDLNARPKWLMEALSVHEASPGHHFQVSIAQEVEALPAFRRFEFETAYVEGWGLYAESLGTELGLYTDPYQYFGSLFADIWRANRLVVDTGMHALGWTREEAIAFMQSNSPIADTDVVIEVERYIAIPGQALAYKIGQLKIRELRNRAEQQLGDQFDVRAFHDQVLTTGSLPLIVLEAHIDRWIASQLDAA
ncbi:MAG: DUF885 domain-containing protein [Pseudomonadota bacterium]